MKPLTKGHPGVPLTMVSAQVAGCCIHALARLLALRPTRARPCSDVDDVQSTKSRQPSQLGHCLLSAARATVVTLVMAVALALSSTTAAGAQARPVAPSQPPVSSEAPPELRGGSDGGPSGASVVFLLMGGWLLWGLLLLFQGRRRLARHRGAAATGAPPISQPET